MESTSGKNKRHTKLFRKRKFDNLSDNSREHLQALEISKEAYDNANVEGTKKKKSTTTADDNNDTENIQIEESASSSTSSK